MAGVTPGKGGQAFEGVPIYNTVSEAVSNTNAKISVIFVPAASLPQRRNGISGKWNQINCSNPGARAHKRFYESN